MKQRIQTALILLVLMIVMLAQPFAAVWAFFAGLMALTALWEYSRLMQFSIKNQVSYTLGTAVFLWVAYCGDWQLPKAIWAIVFAFWLLLMPAWLHFKWKLQGEGARTMVLGWLLMIPFWYALILLKSAGVGALLSVMVLVWLADSGAYFAGRAFGKHLLAPVLSPKKSWEGVLGGLILVLIYMTLARSNGWLAFETSWLATMLIAMILTGVSVGGDLLESWFKRVSNIKDSSQLLPGHGGVFDRVDSLIAVLSVYTAFLVLIN